MTSIALPNSLTSITSSAFESCSSLASISLPAGISSIEDYTFYGCGKLKSFSLPTNLTNIGYGAFVYCPLTSLTIPNKVVSIGDLAFYDCTGLTNFYFQGNAATLGGTNVFLNVNAAAVVYYLPGTTNWSATYGGLPTVMLTPQIAGANSGVSTNGFGFAINGAAGMVVVVEASADLINWQPMLTNTLSGTTFNFSDPQWTNYPGRYYRLRSP